MEVKVKLLSRVQLLATPWIAAHQGFSTHGIFQARVLEWGAIVISEYVIITYNEKESEEYIYSFESLYTLETNTTL